MSFWNFVHLFPYFRGSFAYFLCTRVVTLYAFNEFVLLIYKKSNGKIVQLSYQSSVHVWMLKWLPFFLDK
jgi:hypothetical protein